jgi:hypothetical protein
MNERNLRWLYSHLVQTVNTVHSGNLSSYDTLSDTNSRSLIYQRSRLHGTRHKRKTIKSKAAYTCQFGFLAIASQLRETRALIAAKISEQKRGSKQETASNIA